VLVQLPGGVGDRYEPDGRVLRMLPRLGGPQAPLLRGGIPGLSLCRRSALRDGLTRLRARIEGASTSLAGIARGRSLAAR
jgi:hypothetical protein